MIVTLQTHRLHTMEQVRAFVEGNEAVDYKPPGSGERLRFCERVARSALLPDIGQARQGHRAALSVQDDRQYRVSRSTV